MDRWRGRVALVTGASSGIGAAVCRALVGHGMTVIGCARSDVAIWEMAAEPAREPGKLVAYKCDLSKEDQIMKMFDEIRGNFGGLHLCVNNAGFSTDSPLLTGTTKEWRDMLDVNVLALCICTREAVKLMRQKDIEDGQIIHIGSIEGHSMTHNTSGLNFYSGTKFMVRALTDGLRNELKELGLMRIRTACISPGLVKTDFINRYAKDEEQTKTMCGSMKPMTPEDIAQTLVYFLSAPPHVEIHDIVIRPTDQLI